MQLLKKVVDVAQRMLRPMPFAIEKKFFDRYYDNTLKILCLMGCVIGYIVTPDGKQITFLEPASDIGMARRIGYSKYDTAYRQWIGKASTDDLIALHDKENRSPYRDKTLLLAIEVELNLRSGLKFKNVAFG